MTVTGVASTEVRPDRAVLSLGVQARRASAQGALDLASERAGAVLAALRDAGSGDADVQTTGITLWFDQSAKAYVAAHALRVLVPSDQAGARIDVAAQAAGDEFTMNGVSFTIAEPAPLLAPLREMALADARSKASALASAEGATVGAAITIVEGGAAGAVPVARAALRAMATPVEAGAETLTLQVTVTYEMLA